MVASFAAGLLGAPGLLFSLKPAEPAFRQGDPVRLTAVVRNNTDKSVVMMRALWDGAPAAAGRLRLIKDGRRLDWEGESSMPAVQVMWSPKVDSKRFMVVGPRETKVLYWADVSRLVTLPAGTTGTKEGWSKAVRTPLVPGKYRAEFDYSFDGRQTGISGEAMKYEFAPGADQLWRSAWIGSATVRAEFIVKQG